jgi:hypothetical protein
VDSNSSFKGDIFGNNGPIALIRRTFNCLIMVLCHPPKSNPNDILGHTSIAGNTDMILQTKFDDEHRQKHLITLSCERNKDGPEGMVAYFKIDPEGVPVPLRVASAEGLERPLGLQRRDPHADKSSFIRQHCAEGGNFEFDRGISNLELAKRLTPRGSMTDVEYDDAVKAESKSLSNIQQKLVGKGAITHYDNLTKKDIPTGGTKPEWRWFASLHSRPNADFMAQMMDENAGRMR